MPNGVVPLRTDPSHSPTCIIDILGHLETSGTIRVDTPLHHKKHFAVLQVESDKDLIELREAIGSDVDAVLVGSVAENLAQSLADALSHSAITKPRAFATAATACRNRWRTTE
mmetsp:Transcript_95498/g.309443  ORF Transcript_95498/g.309443 Transcript_95498/m.309443 type:complete len:113 (+) Transcript_95498:1170-1508(+)